MVNFGIVIPPNKPVEEWVKLSRITEDSNAIKNMLGSLKKVPPRLEMRFKNSKKIYEELRDNN